MSLRVFKIFVQPVFVTEGEDGNLEELVGDAKGLTVAQFKALANGGLEESIAATEAALKENDG